MIVNDAPTRTQKGLFGAIKIQQVAERQMIRDQVNLFSKAGSFDVVKNSYLIYLDFTLNKDGNISRGLDCPGAKIGVYHNIGAGPSKSVLRKNSKMENFCVRMITRQRGKYCHLTGTPNDLLL
ncbi:hypothetical protein NPIL_215331 [Nephila pilipes]|uniref:Uncharacterized protein n=1 Tax=Nephila pilipes TaxID=299642 RepID=A0A8X6NZH8_NEPPI|nr:hypothetical protein NPIL_215331 [Nephila pilipes]